MKNSDCCFILSFYKLMKLIGFFILLVINISLVTVQAQMKTVDINKIQADDLLGPNNKFFRLEKMLLDGETSPVDFELESFEVFAPNAKIIVHDEHGKEHVQPRPSTVYFKGNIAGNTDSFVALSVDPSGTIKGIAQNKGKIWNLVSGAAVGGPAIGLASQEVSRSTHLENLPPFRCGVEGKEDESSRPHLQHLINELPPEPALLPSGQFYQVPIAIETDAEFYNLFGSNSAATSYIGELVAYASVIYQREANTKFLITHISLWSGGITSDPWDFNLLDGSGGGLDIFRNYWNNNRTNIERAIAHFFSGKTYADAGGIAQIGGMCSQLGYGFSGHLTGQFNPNNPQQWDIEVFAHEVGHNFSSPHTHCYMNIDGNANPVDACYAKEAGTSCWSGPTSLPGINSLTGGTPGGSNGTIMSYCHDDGFSGGISNIALTFGQNHPYGIAANRVSNKIASYVASVSTAYPTCVAIAGEGADLLVTAVTSPNSGLISSSVPSQITVKNQGTQPVSGSFWVRFYLSLDATITLNDIATPTICTIDGPLAAGQTTTCNANVLIGDSTPPGTYYLGAYADPYNSISEYNENNNGRAATNTITLSRPSYNLTLNQTGSGSGTVSGGGAYTPGATVNLTATPASGSTFAGWSPSPCAASFSMPANDLTCTATFNASANLPDLIVTSVTTANKGVVGSLMNVSSTVYNAGGQATGAFYLWYRLSPDSVITYDDIYGNISFGCYITNLGPGESSTCTQPALIPNVKPGMYYLGAFADDLGQITESNENNNILVAANTVTITLPPDTVGFHNPATGMFYLRNSNSEGIADLSFRYGPVNTNWVPLAGDWDGNGSTTLGFYNPATGMFYLRNSNSNGIADLSFRYGPLNTNWIPLAGDWDGNGSATLGFYNPATGMFYLRNSNSNGIADLSFRYGPLNTNWIPLAGDWDGNGSATLGFYNPATGMFYLRNSNSNGIADLSFRYGPVNTNWTPLIGDWQ